MYTLLSVFAVLLALQPQAQQVQDLPAGRYITLVMPGNLPWTQGPIVLEPSGDYKFSGDSGEYKFSTAAQRVFFTSGPLKGVFALTRMEQGFPTIIFPANEHQPISIQNDIWARRRQ